MIYIQFSKNAFEILYTTYFFQVKKSTNGHTAAAAAAVKQTFLSRQIIRLSVCFLGPI